MVSGLSFLGFYFNFPSFRVKLPWFPRFSYLGLTSESGSPMAESFLFLSALNSFGLMSLAPEVVLENDIFDSGNLHGFFERLGFQLQNEIKTILNLGS